jgi:hypothetical protein
MRQLLELAAQTLSAEAGPSGLALRVTGHLGCELTDVVLVSQRFPSWEHVNLQRGVDAYLAAHAAGAQWFGPAGGGHRPHEDILSMLSMPQTVAMRWAGQRISAGGMVRVGAGGGDGAVGAASYGTAAVGPEENTEVVTLGRVVADRGDLLLSPGRSRRFHANRIARSSSDATADESPAASS